MKDEKLDKIPLNLYIKEAALYILQYNKKYNKTIPLNPKNAKMIAHRGLSNLERENTLPAFKLAGEHTYYGIETDVHKTGDGKYVIIHDDNTLRVSGAYHIVEATDEKTLTSLKLYNMSGAPSDNHRIPSLTEYIEICKKYDKYCVLELKNRFDEHDVYEIADIISKAGYLDKTIFISFDITNLISLRKKYPAQPAQFLTSRYTDGLIGILKKHNLDLDIFYRALNRNRIELLHQAGIKVNCWTVNTLRHARKLDKWGVDYITTNILE
ncbi:MAG: glycerophosphodiester phosphodiesterase [Christensenellales bacterium]